MRLAAGLRSDPLGIDLGAYSTPPDSLAVIRGGNVEGKEAEGIEGREGVRRERMGRGRVSK